MSCYCLRCITVVLLVCRLGKKSGSRDSTPQGRKVRIQHLLVDCNAALSSPLRSQVIIIRSLESAELLSWRIDQIVEKNLSIFVCVSVEPIIFKALIWYLRLGNVTFMKKNTGNISRIFYQNIIMKRYSYCIMHKETGRILWA